MVRIAIIGSGLSGLTLAHHLSEYAQVTVFEKSRGPGGRMSTRYAGPIQFDHGAQFFTAKTEAFQSFLCPLINDHIVQPWHAKFSELQGENTIRRHMWNHQPPHYVGIPGMNAVGKYLARNLTLHLNTQVTHIKPHNGWRLFDHNDQNMGDFDWVITSTPPQQAAAIMPKCFTHYKTICSINMLSCFSLMLGLTKPIELDFDIAIVHEADISLISVNDSKPQRSNSGCLVIHSTNQWATRNFAMPQEQIMEHLCQETRRIIHPDITQAAHRSLHKWQFANIPKQPSHPPLIDYKNKLAACGDWHIQGNVEAAFTSGLYMGKAVLEDIVSSGG